MEEDNEEFLIENNEGKNVIDQIFRLVQVIRMRELKDNVNSKE